MPLSHTDRDYELELQHLREQLLLMGAGVEDLLGICVQALANHDIEGAKTARERDRVIDQLELDIDELCLRVLARRQPVARDLRFIAVALKIVTDLERMGDLGVGICQRALELAAHGGTLQGGPDLLPMANNARQMVREALDALASGDAVAARKIIHRDAVVDAGHALVVRHLLTAMTKEPQAVYAATRLLSVAMAFERIADHATNLAEMVVFLVRGTDIRHPGRHDLPHEQLLPRGILFVCVANAARSQMAEALARVLLPPHVRVFSAGSAPGLAVHPLAVQVLSEIGIDMAGQRPKAIAEVPLVDVDLLVTMCEDAQCPVVSALARRLDWSLPDPAQAAGGQGQLEAFRRSRDAIKQQILTLAAAREA